MNCRMFEHLLPDWIGGRLPLEQSQRMQAHQSQCAVCREAAAEERVLRQRLRALPSEADPPSIWPRLSLQIASVPVKPRRTYFPTWTLGSAVAAVGLAALLLLARSPHHSPIRPAPINTPISNPVTTAVVDERHIVQMISNIRQLPEEESDAFSSDAQQERQTQRRVLLGKEEMR